MSEALYLCALCGRKNFTTKGYSAHRCDKLPDGKKPSLNDRVYVSPPAVGAEVPAAPVELPADRIAASASFLDDIHHGNDDCDPSTSAQGADVQMDATELQMVQPQLRCDTHLTLPCRYEQTTQIDLGKFDGGYRIRLWVVESKGEEQATDRYYFGWAVCNYTEEVRRSEYYSPSFAYCDAQSAMWATTFEDAVYTYMDEVYAMVPETIHAEIKSRLGTYMDGAKLLGYYPKMDRGYADPDLCFWDRIGRAKPEQAPVPYVLPGMAVAPMAALKLPVAVAGSWDGARRWRDVATRLEEGKLFAQVMLGFELLTLKAIHSQPGKRTDLADAGAKPWDQLLQDELGLTKATAYRMTLMAEAAKPKLKKLPELAAFDPSVTSVSALSQETQEALSRVVRKLTDGQTQTEFMEELGLVKARGNKGGRGKGSGGSRSLSIQEQADAMTELARKDWLDLEKGLLANYQDKFLLLPDPEIDAQVGALEKALNARRAYLRQKPELRTQEFIKSISAALQ